VWKFFEKVAAQHPSFQFFHGYGLGVLIPGDRVPAPLAPLIEASRETAHQIRAAYAALGGALTVRAALGEQHREIEAHNTEHVQSLGEIEALKALIATTASERDQAVAALADRHREIEAQNTEHAQSLGEIEALKVLIATTSSERDQAVAALAAGREALASSRASLTEAERSTGLLQATLAGRDVALAEMTQRADEFVAALQSAEAKLAKRDDALSRAESEIVTLRSDLAVARDVGRAALAALRIEPATVPEKPRNAGRRALVLRCFGFRARGPLPLAG
jgi:chromosome segregation ATPase